MPVFEIVRRDSKQHRTGHYGIVIDGWDAEYTNDPAQHMPKMLAQAQVLEGLTGQDAALRALELAEMQSRRVLTRVVERIRSGKLFPGGAPLGISGIDDQQLPRTKVIQATAEEAAVAFMSRGHLAGLDEAGRAERIKERDTKTDHAAVWRANRKALIADRNSKLEKLLLEVTSCHPNKQEKLMKRIERLKNEIAALEVGVVCATHGFQYAYGQYLTKQVDLVNDDIRIVPCMTNTSVDTERDAKDMVSDFTTLDEFDGSGYSTGGLALDSQAVNIDDSNDRAEFDAADEVVASLGAGTRSIDGLLLISFITNLNGSLPLHWLEFASDQTPSGGSFTFQFNAEGIVQAA